MLLEHFSYTASSNQQRTAHFREKAGLMAMYIERVESLTLENPHGFTLGAR